MASLPIFNTGETWSQLHSNLQKQVNQLVHDVKELQAERVVARTTNDALIRAGAAAETAKAEAERKLAVSRALFESMHKHHRACPGNMSTQDDQAWDYGVKLQDQNKELTKEVKELKDERSRLENDLAFKTQESETKEKEAAVLQHRKDELTQQLTKVRQNLEQETKDAADIRNNLDTAYADLTRKEEEHRALRKQKDDAEAELYSAKLQIQDAHDHYQQSQKRVEELESQRSAIEALEQENATLQNEVDNMQEALNDHDRTVLVKDARIAYLENQVQKALTAAARAQDEQNKANAAEDPTTAESTSVAIAPVVSLQDEFEDLSEPADDLFDTEAASQLEPSLELVTAITTANIAPFDAPTTTSSTQTAVSPAQAVTYSTQTEVSTTADIAPIDAPTTTSFTQTTVSSAQALTSLTQTEVSTTADIPPTEPQQPALDIALATPVAIAPVEPSTTLSASDVRILWDNQIEPALRKLVPSSSHTVHFIVERVQDLTDSMRTTSATQVEHEETEAEELSISPFTTAAHIAPVESSTTQTDPPKLTQTGTSTVLDLPSVVHEDRHTQTNIQSPSHVVVVRKKSSILSLSTALALFFALLSIFYYVELESWKHSNNRAGVNRLYNSMGYQRRGRHLFRHHSSLLRAGERRG
ncbi:uncharacterized protein N0V89_004712 [Didymosphaeria variabile]|uniref:Uncharacterized protein n=1 Tax=Didymosphaeria variabile TaxID=1932322 RepID=A0A9W8XSC0_9PLEO|nr:uncharacterized protein N0V89_004712 [Didymosphaeria variabile]KAJ4356676.1 hypothetical protein N0V89_004712 [Didymosphaeria variabile]